MRKILTILSLAAMLASAGPAPALAQVQTVDPNQVIDGDLARSQALPRTGSVPVAPPRNPMSSNPLQPNPLPTNALPTNSSLPYQQQSPSPSNPQYPPYDPSQPNQRAGIDPAVPLPDTARVAARADAATGQTFKREEILSAAEGTFGKGAAGLAGILERTLKEQGEPNAYISGREAGGAVVLGLRYGKGKMFHKVEGEMPVHWTGPSLGFDLGGDADKVFVLVYNLFDSEDLFRRFPAGEGRLYFVGGFAATYLRRGNIVLIPIRLGIGWRQGVNLGYMKFSHKGKWLPF